MKTKYSPDMRYLVLILSKKEEDKLRATVLKSSSLNNAILVEPEGSTMGLKIEVK